MGALLAAFHIVMFSVWLLGVYTNWFLEPDIRGPTYNFDLQQFGGRLKYLTFLNGVLHCMFFGLCMLVDLDNWNAVSSHRRSHQKLLDTIFTTLVFPLGWFVPLIFWSLYLVDRELIFPASMDVWFPGWLNHIMHTLPAIGSLAELILIQHHVTTGIKSYVPIVLAYACYVTWICYIAYTAGIWVYPVFEILDFKLRSALISFLLLPSLILVYLCPKIHQLVWGSPKASRKRNGKRD